MKIKFGPAGLGHPGIEGLDIIHSAGLEAAEVEFTYGVRMTNSTAKEIGKKADNLGISLSVHAPFYINLASKEKPKVHASVNRILRASERAHYLGAKYVVFHAGFYQGRPEEEVFQMIKDQMIKVKEKIDDKGFDVKLAPETTGKPTQFCGLDTLLRLRKETGCEICIDFAHLYARNQGVIDYNEVLKKIKDLKHLHCHFSGINYTQKGERNHELLTKSFFKPLKEAIKNNKPKSMTIINESPDVLGDAIKLKKWFYE